MILYLSILIFITHLIGRLLFVKKIWIAPIYAVAQETLWIILFLCTGGGTWPLIALSLCDAALYMGAMPKWYRERK
jgi:hypothetical protein